MTQTNKQIICKPSRNYHWLFVHNRSSNSTTHCRCYRSYIWTQFKHFGLFFVKVQSLVLAVLGHVGVFLTLKSIFLQLWYLSAQCKGWRGDWVFLWKPWELWEVQIPNICFQASACWRNSLTVLKGAYWLSHLRVQPKDFYLCRVELLDYSRNHIHNYFGLYSII